MKGFVFFLSILSVSANAAVTCQDLDHAESSEIQVVGGGEVLTEENWKNFDVVAGFGPKECFRSMRQEKIEFRGETFWRFRSTEDSCDGGNVYGSIYSEDLKTPIAHIYDSDIVCEEYWREDNLAENHKCDLEAEKFAVEKAKAAGFELRVTDHFLDLEELGFYKAFTADGYLSTGHNASVTVLFKLDSCKMHSATLNVALW